MQYNNNNNNNYSDNDQGDGSFRVAPPNARPDPYAQRGPNYPNYGNQMAQQVGQGMAANIGENVAEKVADNLGQKIKQQAGGAFQNFKRQATNIMSDPQKRKQIQEDITSFGRVDKQVWLIVSDVQNVPSPCSWILALINLFLPGFGTIISSCFGSSCSKTQFSVGILQMALGPLLIGYVWSWYWSYLIIRKSVDEANDDQDDDSFEKQKQKINTGPPSDKNIDNHRHHQFSDDDI